MLHISCLDLIFQVTAYYGHNPKIHYVVEQPGFPGLLKLVGKRFLRISSRRKANGHKSAEEDFWWACGHCFFERRKKSTIKAHVTQMVCQKSIENKQSRRKLTSRQLSQSTLDGYKLKGYSWKRSFSVWESYRSDVSPCFEVHMGLFGEQIFQLRDIMM